MEKLKVSKEIKLDLDKVLEVNKEIDIISRHAFNGWEHRKSLNCLSLEEIIIALTVGYELEKTPEEELLEFYSAETNDSVFENGVNFGIKFALDKLNIKIKGINA